MLKGFDFAIWEIKYEVGIFPINSILCFSSKYGMEW